jgi:hypothetical protein
MQNCPPSRRAAEPPSRRAAEPPVMRRISDIRPGFHVNLFYREDFVYLYDELSSPGKMSSRSCRLPPDSSSWLTPFWGATAAQARSRPPARLEPDVPESQPVLVRHRNLRNIVITSSVTMCACRALGMTRTSVAQQEAARMSRAASRSAAVMSVRHYSRARSPKWAGTVDRMMGSLPRLVCTQALTQPALIRDHRQPDEAEICRDSGRKPGGDCGYPQLPAPRPLRSAGRHQRSPSSGQTFGACVPLSMSMSRMRCSMSKRVSR